MKLWLKGAKQIVQVVSNGEKFLTKNDMKNLAIIEAENDRNGLSIIVDDSGKLFDMGSDIEMEKKYIKTKFDKIVTVFGKSIVPGIIHSVVLKKNSAKKKKLHN